MAPGRRGGSGWSGDGCIRLECGGARASRGGRLGLERAKQVMAAAEAEAKKRNWKMNIAVVDTNGELVHFSRMEGAQIASGNIACSAVHHLADEAFTDAAFDSVLAADLKAEFGNVGLAAAAPHTPSPNAIRIQAGRPWNGPTTSSPSTLR